MINIYQKQVKLLIQLLSLIDMEKSFALKGGTAINLFVQNLPRLSVDIDLVYLLDEQRSTALIKIKNALDRIADKITVQLKPAKVVKSYLSKEDALRLVVSNQGVTVKIELSPVLRGTVFAPERMAVVKNVEEEFGYAEIKVVSFADLYAGKICAALDRQHPRDLFDVKFLLDDSGFNKAVRKALIVYLVSHPRPLTELINPRLKELASQFESEFKGMTFVEVSLLELKACREKLIKLIKSSFTENEKSFLLSFYQNPVLWELLAIDNVKKLPAVKWKQLNIAKMSDSKRDKEIESLKKILEIC